ncbi:MAG: hypothetical protein JKX70_03320 [Phycisphaerales bacterium]|nr:hypothetical protein [Phycisphaerales bacterium]
MIGPVGRWITSVADCLGAIWVLISLAFVSRFRFGGQYWVWRTATAFPEGAHPDGKVGMVQAVFEYARWAWRIRRMR